PHPPGSVDPGLESAPPGRVYSASVERDRGVDISVRGRPQGDGPAHAEADDADPWCAAGAQVSGRVGDVRRDLFAVERGHHGAGAGEVAIADDHVAAAVIQVRSGGEIADVGEHAQQPLDVFVDPPGLLDHDDAGA